MGRRVSFAPGKQLDEIKEYQKNAAEWNDAPVAQREEAEALAAPPPREQAPTEHMLLPSSAPKPQLT